MITYSTSFRSFLINSDSRIAKILAKVDRDMWRFGRKYKEIVTTEKVNYITFRSDGTISYLPAGKEHAVNDDGGWARQNRQNGRPGKVIQKLFTDKMLKVIPNKEFEIFSNKYKAEYNEDGLTFHLLENKKIPHVYGMERKPGGRLGDSCMNDDKSYMEIYKKCDKCKILILKDSEGLLCGRALVWFISDDFTLLDRIYTSSDYYDDMFIDYAVDKKWHYKKHYKTYDYKTIFITPAGKQIFKDLTIHTDTDCDAYPYIDTFSYGNDGSLNNYDEDETMYVYDCTDGERTERSPEDDHEGEIYDEISGRYISDEDAVCIDRGRRRGLYTHRDNAIRDVHDNYWLEDENDLIYVESEGEYYPSNEVTWVKREEDYYPSDDCVYSEHGDEDLLRSQAVEHDGDWYQIGEVPDDEPEADEEETETKETITDDQPF